MEKIIDALLAPILDKFKAANPRLWLIITFALTLVAYSAQQGELFGLIQIEGTVKSVVIGVTWLLAVLNGSRTTNILKGDMMSEISLQLDLTKQKLEEMKQENTDLKEQLDS